MRTLGTYGSDEPAGDSTKFTSNTHRSSVVLESFVIMAKTNCVTDPVRSHAMPTSIVFLSTMEMAYC